MFGSMLQKAGVGNDIYGLCDIDLKDFSLQGMHEDISSLQYLLHLGIQNNIVYFPWHHLANWSSFWPARLVSSTTSSGSS